MHATTTLHETRRALGLAEALYAETGNPMWRLHAVLLREDVRELEEIAGPDDETGDLPDDDDDSEGEELSS
jgi:hypothetical protein